MKVRMSTGGGVSTAPTLVIDDYRPCAEGVVLTTFRKSPGGTDQSGLTTQIVDGATKQSKDGSVSVMLRVRVKTPVPQYNTNTGNTNVHTPEIQAHVVLRVPRIVALALSGAMPGSGSSSSLQYPFDAAASAVSTALCTLMAVAANTPGNYTEVFGSLTASPLYFGTQGICPLDYLNGDYGTIRVAPPPAS